MKKNILVPIVTALLVVMIAMSCSAAYPEREITIIVPFGTGGETDTALRIISPKLGEILGVPVTVVNRSGGGGAVGMTEVAKAKPDGYTLGAMTEACIVAQPHLMDLLYDIESFEYVNGLFQYLYGVTVRADSPYKTFEDLVEEAKKRPVFYSVGSIANTVPMVQINEKYGTQFEEILYESGGDSVLGLLRAEVEATVQQPTTVAPHIKSGEFRVIAPTGRNRWLVAPDVPILSEQGYDVVYQGAGAIVAPAGTPQGVIDALSAAFDEVFADEDMCNKWLKITGYNPELMSGPDVKAGFAERHALVGRIFKEMGVID